MGEFMEFELSVHRPGYTFFDWQRKYSYISPVWIKLTPLRIGGTPNRHFPWYVELGLLVSDPVL